LSASLLFVFIGFCADDHPAKILAKQVYLFYNVLTMLVWCAEVGCHMFVPSNNNHHNNNNEYANPSPTTTTTTRTHDSRPR
jgi:hypothetical protein